MRLDCHHLGSYTNEFLGKGGRKLCTCYSECRPHPLDVPHFCEREFCKEIGFSRVSGFQGYNGNICHLDFCRLLVRQDTQPKI